MEENEIEHDEKLKAQWIKEQTEKDFNNHALFIEKIVTKPECWVKENLDKKVYFEMFSSGEILDHLFLSMEVIKEKIDIIDNLNKEVKSLKEINNDVLFLKDNNEVKE